MPRGIDWVQPQAEPRPAVRTEQERQERFLTILAIVGVLLMVGLFGLLRYMDHWKAQQVAADQAAFVAAADRVAAEVPATFEAWHESTSKGGQVLDWSGKGASVIWVERRVNPYGSTGQFVVWAMTPNKRYFTVSFSMDEEWKLKRSGEFKEWAVDDLIRALTAAGQSELVAKLRLVRSPA